MALINENLLAPTTTIGQQVRFLRIICLRFTLDAQFLARAKKRVHGVAAL